MPWVQFISLMPSMRWPAFFLGFSLGFETLETDEGIPDNCERTDSILDEGLSVANVLSGSQHKPLCGDDWQGVAQFAPPLATVDSVLKACPNFHHAVMLKGRHQLLE